MLSAYNNKRDANEGEIVATLRDHGFSVERLNTPLDLLVGYGGRTFLVEVKTPKGKFTKSQIKFLETWRGDVTVFRSAEEVEKWCAEIRAGATDPIEFARSTSMTIPFEGVVK